MVDAILDEKVDAGYLYTLACEHYVQNDIRNRLTSQSMYDGVLDYTVAVKAASDSFLYSIMTKCVDSISSADLAKASADYAQIKPTFSLVAFFYDHPLLVIIIVVSIFTFIILLTYVLRQRKKHQLDVERMAEEKRRSELLQAALSEAEKADVAKSQFLSRVSHEMRTPLNAIIGFMELSKDATIQQQMEYRDYSMTAAKQLLSVINDVLDMSAIESGKMKLNLTDFNFTHLVHTVSELYFSQCKAKGLTYNTFITTHVPEWLIGDQLRLNQILTNLLGNAVKFTASGSITLTISQLSQKKDQVFIRFVVKDTGRGMSPEFTKRVFVAFEQENADTAARYGGSGLGLSIVHNIVSMMDGAVNVESEQGVGSTFTVDLPFGRSKAGRAVRLPQGMKAINVLVVDDEPIENKYVSTLLKRLKVDHACVTSAAQALSELDQKAHSEKPYNICLIDWRMPDMDGLTLTKAIRKKYGRDIVVIVISSYEQNQGKTACQQAGADMFIPKPLFQSTLFDLFMTLAGEPEPDVATPVSTISHKLAGHRILLAEDNAMNRKVAVAILQKLGLEIITAEDGQKAVDAFITSAPGYYDAILMDIQMPVLDGYGATHLIRTSNHPQASSIPIIALSANAFNEDVAKSLSNGMNDHVSKPIDVTILANALAKAFERNSQKHDE